MAQKIQVLFEDDVDGSKAEGTVRFGLDGTDYEIDLNTEHADDLRKIYAPYIEKARKITLSGRPTRRARASSAPSGINPTEIREWAKSQGIEVRDRGRVPAELIARFKTAQSSPVPAPEAPDQSEYTPKRRRPSKSKASQAS